MTDHKNGTTRPITPGTAVRVSSLNRSGVVADGPDRKNKYQVSLGGLSLWVPASELTPSSPSKKRKPQNKTSSKPRLLNGPPKETSDSAKIDLHGFTVDLAIEALVSAIDRALVLGCSRIEVIHGIGSGALRKAVHSYLTSSRYVAKFRIDDTNPGTTWVDL